MTGSDYRTIKKAPCCTIDLCNFTHLSSRYLDDMPEIQGELHGALVLSARAHATITVDTSEALKMAGVRGFVGVEDVPGSNIIGTVGLCI